MTMTSSLFSPPGVAAVEKGIENGNYNGNKQFTFKVYTFNIPCIGYRSIIQYWKAIHRK